jgi:streptogrisin C
VTTTPTPTPTATATPTPTPTAPATCATVKTGTLGGTDEESIQPDGSYYQSTTAGQHSGCLTGPGNVDFDLYLQKWNGSVWSTVTSGLGSTATENVTYNGTAGYYRWRVYSYRGAGTYTLKFSRPA